jgi:cob(I)alamin adenosyltransferase
MTVFVFTGDGVGKTTAAVGRAIRHVGEGRQAVIVQFMKGRPTGEYIIQNNLKPYFTVYQFGREEWVNLQSPDRRDKELAENGLKMVSEVIKDNPDVLVLDEINLACHTGLVEKGDVMDLLERAPPDMEIILTGRCAPVEFVKTADIVSEILPIKIKRGFK